MGPVVVPREQRPTPPPVCPEAPRRAARILVIDDNPACRRMAWRMLEAAGFNPIEAATGMEGIERTRDLMPDMILLDLHLPGMSGFDVLKILHGAAQTRHIPVLCVTGEADPAGLLRDASLGMAAFGYLRKPFTREELLVEIERGLAITTGEPAEPGRMLRRGSILADRLERKVWVGDRQVEMVGHRQFPLLWALMRRGGPAGVEDLLREVWSEGESPKAVVMAVIRLRRTLAVAEAPCRIETVGHGYQFVVEAGAAPKEAVAVLDGRRGLDGW